MSQTARQIAIERLKDVAEISGGICHHCGLADVAPDLLAHILALEACCAALEKSVKRVKADLVLLKSVAPADVQGHLTIMITDLRAALQEQPNES